MRYRRYRCPVPARYHHSVYVKAHYLRSLSRKLLPFRPHPSRAVQLDFLSFYRYVPFALYYRALSRAYHDSSAAFYLYPFRFDLYSFFSLERQFAALYSYSPQRIPHPDPFASQFHIQRASGAFDHDMLFPFPVVQLEPMMSRLYDNAFCRSFRIPLRRAMFFIPQISGHYHIVSFSVCPQHHYLRPDFRYKPDPASFSAPAMQHRQPRRYRACSKHIACHAQPPLTLGIVIVRYRPQRAPKLLLPLLFTLRYLSRYPFSRIRVFFQQL